MMAPGVFSDDPKYTPIFATGAREFALISFGIRGAIRHPKIWSRESLWYAAPRNALYGSVPVVHGTLLIRKLARCSAGPASSS